MLTHITWRGSTSPKTAGMIPHSSTEGWRPSQVNPPFPHLSPQLHFLQWKYSLDCISSTLYTPISQITNFIEVSAFETNTEQIRVLFFLNQQQQQKPEHKISLFAKPKARSSGVWHSSPCESLNTTSYLAIHHSLYYGSPKETLWQIFSYGS